MFQKRGSDDSGLEIHWNAGLLAHNDRYLLDLGIIPATLPSEKHIAKLTTLNGLKRLM